MSWLDRFWIQLEKGQVVRRISLFATAYLTWVTYNWTFAYISSLGASALDAGILIGAILGPVSALQGAILKFYAENPYKPNIMLEKDIEKEDM